MGERKGESVERTRFYRHMPDVGVSFGMEWVKDKQTVVVTAAVAGKDQWCRKTAREIIDLRLDGADATLKALGIKRFLAVFPYDGDKPCRDVLNKLPVGRKTRNGPADEVFLSLVETVLENTKQDLGFVEAVG